MEYLVVRFGAQSERRGVLVNGNQFGQTNTVIQVEAGTHTIALAAPADFSPATQTVVVVDTSALAPLTVAFNPAPAPTAPLATASPKPTPPASRKPA